MDRLFLNKLEDWKVSANRKPLIISGARQIGKTFTINDFGKKRFRGKSMWLILKNTRTGLAFLR